MEGGILEVLVVNAEGIKPRNLFGKPAYYVVIQCGTEVRRSKATRGYHHEAFWNQKFEFDFSFSEWKNLTHLEISIMDDESFNDTGFVGRSMIFLGGIIAEGNDRGIVELHPSAYNVVHEDTTYEGEIKIGLKFEVYKEGHKATKEKTVQVTEAGHDVYRSLFRALKISWWRVLFPYGPY
ncbi:elicitor-responsive protein 3-like [Chenopodium quinoa]|uniref:C2 domain-containing protein n=1 Tax=Chenopodium quinoa TaxID=63459 RepID=A0A803KZ96_CHEQI|nr:elicitor-responsive protein 3-like [Chenopodium quinoa]